MKKYETPIIEFENVEIEDVLRASGIEWSKSNIGFNQVDEVLWGDWIWRRYLN